MPTHPPQPHPPSLSGAESRLDLALFPALLLGLSPEPPWFCPIPTLIPGKAGGGAQRLNVIGGNSCTGKAPGGGFLTKTSVSGPKLSLQGIFLPLAWRTWSRLHYSQGFRIAQDIVTGHGTSPCDPDVNMRFSRSVSSPLLPGGLCPSLTRPLPGLKGKGGQFGHSVVFLGSVPQANIPHMARGLSPA